MADTPDPLTMSDEEFMRMDPSSFDDVEEDILAVEEDAPAEEDEDEEEVQEEDEESPDSEDEEEDNSGEEDPESEETEEDGRDPEDIEEDEDSDKDEQSKDSEETGGLTEAQYAAIGRQITAEFKANGRAIQVKSADDAIQLMQMGANYHKKMAGLKPSLKTLKLLENNDLLDPEKLNYLIDLSQKKPEAIKQLLKDSSLDPLDLNLDDGNEERYVPQHRTVSDTDIALDDVLDSIKETSTYNKTLTVLGDEWDDASREAIGKTPEFIRTINMHMENGVYDQVATAVDYQRSLGNLVGISDLDAYQRVGAYMHENKLFVATGNAASQNSQRAQTNAAPPKTDSVAEKLERQNRKKAASPSRQKKAPVKDNSNYNPLEMSDEEFIKLNNMNV